MEQKKKIKDLTAKAMEPQLQSILLKHKEDMKTLKEKQSEQIVEA